MVTQWSPSLELQLRTSELRDVVGPAPELVGPALELVGDHTDHPSEKHGEGVMALPVFGKTNPGRTVPSFSYWSR